MDLKSERLVFGELGAVLKIQRQRQGFTLERVAEASALSLSMLQKIEAGSRYPTFESFERICRELKVELGQILEQAVSFRDIMAGFIQGRLATYVVERAGSKEPWEVCPVDSLDLARERLSDKKREMVLDGYLDPSDGVSLRLSEPKEIERWRLQVTEEIARGRLTPSGEGLQEIYNQSAWLSNRFHEIESENERRVLGGEDGTELPPTGVVAPVG